jgi:hypothetical protein
VPKKNNLTVKLTDLGVIAPSVGGGADPTLVGASLVLFNPSTAESETYALPAGNWSISGDPARLRGYKYRDSDFAAGPCKSVKLTVTGKLAAKCKGPLIGFTLDEATQDNLGMSLRFDTLQTCTVFGGVVKRDTSSAGGNLGRFVATNAAEPAVCAAP